MVRRHYGHRDRLGLDELDSLSYTSSALSINRLLRAKRRHLCASLGHVDSAIHIISRDLAGHDPGSNKFVVSGNGTHGLRDTHRYVGLGLCSALGRMGRVLCVGFVDGGRGGRRLGDPFPLIHSVRQFQFPRTRGLY